MDKQLRVAQVLGVMTGYGVEAFVMNHYRFIDRSKVQFDFFVNEDSTKVPYEEIEKLGGRVYRIPSYRRLGKYISTLTRIFRENRYQIVHSHVNTLSVFPLYAAKKAGVPIRVSQSHSSAARGEGKKNIAKNILRTFSRTYATDYAACSVSAGTWLFGKKATERGQVTVLHNVIDVKACVYDPDVRAQVRRQLELDGKFVVGHVGRFCFQKNQEFVLDIFKIVHECNSDSILLLVGDGETRDQLEKKAEKLGIRDRVIMLGNRDDVGRLYQAMDVLVFPSRYEGLPLVPVEAQAAGLKVVISTRISPEIRMRDGVVFLELSDPAERWAMEALRLNPGVREYRGDFSSYDMAFQAEEMERYYQALLDRRSGNVRK